MAFAAIISLLLVFPVFTSALPKRDTSQAAWDALNKTVNGQLYTAIPFARPCFQSSSLAGTFDEAACQSVQANYLNATVRSNTFATYMASQSETCSATGAQCYLDWQNVTNPAAVSSSETCSQGSVSTHYIDVKKASDVQAAFQFSSKTGVPLVIKNTGHDYAGRSSLANSLGLWSHNLKSKTFNAKFTPQGCPAKTTFPAATIGAGVQTAELYEYADQQGITIPGGACVSVGIAGGYLQGGGHSWLSNIYGLAVDRVLEFEVVTPTGQHLFANACQNTDLYFALRGGGGGTFGFVLSATMKALPKASYISVEVTYTSTPDTLKTFLSFLISNAVKWSTDGWSGQIRPGAKLVLTAVNTTEAAATAYFSDLQGVAQSIGGAFSVVTTPSYLAFHNKFIVPDALNELDGIPQTVGSRLISAQTFSNSADELLDSLVNIVTNSQVSFIFANAPFSFKQDASLGPASVNPAWRNSLWHVVAGAGWTFDTPASVQSIIYDSLTSGIDTLRNITPSSGAYLNEADLHEPNYSESFWGSNYDQLVQIKKKYDPQHLLDCWHCVGWKGAADASFSCYL
ncbi:FAD-binding domain-containing protein [Mycena albidolilacea]|uniref:FAD-binding domain-containing protein n=1 Tax=Mycena albidolilacea TaxID=1033008 RepID=A0AAD7A1M1_9AGAR|nr:FAD-binding domain-containing protein [Mycena albidolilacea]